MLGIPLIVMKKLLFLFASIAMMVACTEGDTEGNDTPTPQPPKPSITIDSASLSSFNEEGGSGKISFTASEAWSAEVINSRADSWISIHPTSGAAGEATVTVTTEPNDTPDERSASIVIKAGSASQTIKVSQKQKDALTVTAASFEVSNEGGQIEIEVKANIDFEYEIEESAKEWVTYEGTRALKTSTLTFAVAENDDVEKREAKINITSGKFNEVVTIYQTGVEPTMVISQNEYKVSAAGETIAVEVASNVDVTVELPADADWISENATRGVSTNTFYFDIAASEEYDQRTAEIKFSNADKGLSESVTVVQAQKDALVVAEDSYSVGSEGGEIEISIGHNVEFDIKIDGDWISQAQTRALETSTLLFVVAENDTEAERNGSITFTAKDNDEISQVITVKQETDTSKIYYTTTDGNIVSISAYTDWGGAQIVSNTYENGQGVITFDREITTIGNNAFYERPNLKEIHIPNSVLTIGNSAFARCVNLEEVNLPGSAIEIGTWIFAYCTLLNDVTIESGITSIPEYSFAYCSSLTEIKIPDSVKLIDNDAFEGCSSLTSIIIPNSVSKIGENVFRGCSSLKDVTIGSGITSITGGSFDGCSSLEEITIPDNITSIESAAFRSCSSLSSITIPNSVTSIGINVFGGCTNLSAFYGKYASSDNRALVVDGKLIAFAPYGLTEYSIPDGVTAIENYTFYGCKNLPLVNIPDSVTSIGEYAFAYCSSLKKIVIPESITKLSRNTFMYCSSLTEVTLPNNLADTGTGTFAYCSSLKSINIPENITIINTSAFLECSALESIIIPDKVETIGANAFQRCTNLKSVTIPDNVKTVGAYAFEKCTNLKSLTIGSGVANWRTTNSDYGHTFENCTSLTDVTIAEGVREICTYMFDYCTSLTEITFPSSIESIAYFDYKSSLVAVYCKAATPPSFSGRFYSTTIDNLKIYVPTASVNAYKAAKDWKNYADKIVGYEF